MLSVLRSVQGPTQAQPHCVGCHLCEEDGYDEAILYMEEWDDEQALHQHVRSDLYGRILAAVELSRMPPEFTFYHVKETQGIDLIETVRSQPITGDGDLDTRNL